MGTRRTLLAFEIRCLEPFASHSVSLEGYRTRWGSQNMSDLKTTPEYLSLDPQTSITEFSAFKKA